MPTNTAVLSPPARSSASSRVRVLQGLLYTGFWVVMLFVAAGTVHWTRGLICCVTYGVSVLVMGGVVQRLNPALLPARTQWRHRDTKPFDKIILAIFLPLSTIQPVVAGLDVVRFHWSSMPLSTLPLGLALFIPGMSLIGWAMAVNPWAEGTVRIQSDRGQQVVRTGAYRFVRHPMYLGMVLMNPGFACMFGSAWLLVLSGLMAVILVVRTALEDATLQRELHGYSEYARGTRWRLVPGVW